MAKLLAVVRLVVLVVVKVVVLVVVLAVVWLSPESLVIEVKAVGITFCPSSREEKVAVWLRLTMKTCSLTPVMSSDLGAIQFTLMNKSFK